MEKIVIDLENVIESYELCKDEIAEMNYILLEFISTGDICLEKNQHLVNSCLMTILDQVRIPIFNYVKNMEEK